MSSQEFKLLLSGHDTIECAYYLAPSEGCMLDYEWLAVEREGMRLSKTRKPTLIKLGCEEFMLAGHGTSSGFTFLIENEAFSIQFGEFARPNFFVTFRSIALWHQGAQGLHERFIAWAASVGMSPFQRERLSRVDFTFDYHLPVIDFDEENFVTSFSRDNRHRKDRKVQTFKFGEGELGLCIYNKCAEITEKSAKTWFYKLWGVEEDVWRIEWRARKKWLRQIGIVTFEDLKERQGDLLRVLVNDHTTLRIKTDDSNRSRWPVQPLWIDLAERIGSMECQGVYRVIDDKEALNEQLMWIAISTYGNLKRIGAIHSVRQGTDFTGFKEASLQLEQMLKLVHDPMTWKADVDNRIKEIQFGQW